MATLGKLAILTASGMGVAAFAMLPLFMPTRADEPDAWISQCRETVTIPDDRTYAPSPKTEYLAVRLPADVPQIDVRRGVALNVSRRFDTYAMRRLPDGRYLVPLPTDDGSRQFTILDGKTFVPIYPPSGGGFRPAELEHRETGCGAPAL